MIEPKPEAEPAALEELPAGAGGGAGSGAGAGFAPLGPELPSLPPVSPREAEVIAADAAMTAPPAIVVGPTTGVAATLALAECCSPLLDWRLTLGDEGPAVELEGAPSTALQPATPPLGDAAVDAW